MVKYHNSEPFIGKPRHPLLEVHPLYGFSLIIFQFPTFVQLNPRENCNFDHIQLDIWAESTYLTNVYTCINSRELASNSELEFKCTMYINDFLILFMCLQC